jgi:hypothetical protein
MEKDKVKVMYDEKGTAVRIQMDFDLYQMLMEHIHRSEQSFAAAH